jgi:phosphoribosylformylglycinamidine cyclo-ligase
VGLASYGQATYEATYNSGIASNGLTAARHDVLSHHYAEHFPEAYDPNMPGDLIFTGSRRLTQPYGDHTTGQLLLSPTRTFTPVLKEVLGRHRGRIGGIIHNTGGAHSKVLNFVKGVKITKNNLLPVPPVFQMIQEESDATWEEMYKVFNMGTRLEIYLGENEAQDVIDIARQFNIEAQVIGSVEKAEKASVVLETPHGTITYAS